MDCIDHLGLQATEQEHGMFGLATGGFLDSAIGHSQRASSEMSFANRLTAELSPIVCEDAYNSLKPKSVVSVPCGYLVALFAAIIAAPCARPHR